MKPSLLDPTKATWRELQDGDEWQLVVIVDNDWIDVVVSIQQAIVSIQQAIRGPQPYIVCVWDRGTWADNAAANTLEEALHYAETLYATGAVKADRWRYKEEFLQDHPEIKYEPETTNAE
jgi:hypothetical protein